MRQRGFPAAHADIPNLAPMVDVIMVILIFFMLGTSFAISEGVLPTQLPSQIGPGGGATVTIMPVVRIGLLEQEGGLGCRIVVMERELSENSFEALSAFLAAKLAAGADPTGRVLIGAEPGVQYQHVISAMDACVRAGFSNIQFSVGGSARTWIE
ncbi:MAG: biopolymer transporter ExbD [Phycisphaerae bacterium]|nr:biopolymer transporter ExbD [Phycisphaerae bacterium]